MAGLVRFGGALAGLLLCFCSVDDQPRTFGTAGKGGEPSTPQGGASGARNNESTTGGTHSGVTGTPNTSGTAGQNSPAQGGSATGGTASSATGGQAPAPEGGAAGSDTSEPESTGGRTTTGEGGAGADDGVGGEGGEPPVVRRKRIATNGYQTCAISRGGTVSCVGSNYKQRFIQDASETLSVATQVPNLSDVVDLVLSVDYWCALLADGSGKCWGQMNGVLGLGESEPVRSPITSPELKDTKQLSANPSNICAIFRDESLRCAGYSLGLGNGTEENSSAFVPVSLLQTARQIAHGITHSCALLLNGGVACWGYDIYGVFGTYDLIPHAFDRPATMPGVSRAVRITAGGYHSCAKREDNTAVCWGNNGAGQLGVGNLLPADGGVSVVASPNSAATMLDKVVDIVAGYQHTCALLEDRTVRCWGSNDSGELGNGTTTPESRPTAVAGLQNVEQVVSAVTTSGTCALLKDDTVKCWGGTQGLTPTIVPGL